MAFVETNRLAEILSEGWPTLQPLSIAPLKASKTATGVWEVTTTTASFILKGSSDARFGHQSSVLHYLAANHLPIALPIPSKTGPVHTTHGTRYILSPKLPGSHQHLRLGQPAGETWAHRFGEVLGRLHASLAQMPPLLSLRTVDVHQHVVASAFPLLRAHPLLANDSQLGKTMQTYACQFGLQSRDLVVHPIHRDFHTGNLLFFNANLTGIIDFDLAEINIRLWDPCYLATSTLVYVVRGEASIQQWLTTFRAIIAGYETHCPLTPIERRLLPEVLQSIQFSFMAYWAAKQRSDLMWENTKALRLLESQRGKISRCS